MIIWIALELRGVEQIAYVIEEKASWLDQKKEWEEGEVLEPRDISYF